MQGGRRDQLERTCWEDKAELSAGPCASLLHTRDKAVAASRLQPRCQIKSPSQLRACAREAQERLERAWWEEKAELSAGPAEQGTGGRFSDSAQEPESGHTSWQAGT